MNPLNPSIKAATILGNYEYKIDSNISSGFNLTAKINDLRVEVTDYLPLFGTDLNTESIDKEVQKKVSLI